MKSQFWKTTWFAIVMVVLFPIVGIILTWNSNMKKNSKIVATVVACLFMFFFYPRVFRPAAVPSDDPPLQQISGSVENNEDLKTSMDGAKDSWSNLFDSLF